MAALLIALALAVLGFALWLRGRTGVPWTRIVRSDVGTELVLDRPLFSRRYQLTGKPDYLLEQRGRYIPVEVKPSRHATTPYDADLMQLAAYCLLIEEVYGQTPPYGLLRYAESTFRLDYTARVRADLLAVIAEMQELLPADDVERDHDDPRRCVGCGFREQCEDRLVE
jgi:CRISPR-associated exonuclease Cas4